jgi:hypothetical protein
VATAAAALALAEMEPMESVKQSSFDSRLGRLLFSMTIPCVIVLVSCYEHEPCGSEELCNYADDNCDGRIDEIFRDEDGSYVGLENCGACGVDCAVVIPFGDELVCEELEGGYGCRALSCVEGYHVSGRTCVPDVDVLCMACEEDSDCQVFDPTSRCRETGSARRCLRSCAAGCPDGFECRSEECAPISGVCACTAETEGVAFGCLLETASAACAGRQICSENVLGLCEPAFEEICNGEDDDCDGGIDEDFIDDAGRYVHVDHCGECNRPCAAQGPNVVATCEVIAGSPTCLQECEEGFVDLDGVDANGCECERTVGSWPPSRLGVDADCDGEIDDTDDFIFVASWGADTSPGTLVFPLRTLGAGMELAASVSKTVLVTGGIFNERIEVVGGVEVYGGYNADFSDRDPALYATVIRPSDSAHGLPVLTCQGVTSAAAIGGMTITGSDAAEPGQGSTAVFLDGCSAAVELVELTVLAARGADGRMGADASDNLAEWGLTSLTELNGDNGRNGQDGFETSSPSCTSESVAAGRGGRHQCPGTGNNLNGGDGGDSRCVDVGCRVGQPCGNSGCTDFMVGDVCDVDAMMAAAVPNPPGEDGSGPGAGAGGSSTYHAPTNRGSCHFCDDNPTLVRLGEPGEAGRDGEDGLGGGGCATVAGVFDGATGRWRGLSGGVGAAGSDGGGGGGGSAGAGYEVIEGITEACNDAIGGSGGGGGSGGCGAPHASGGGGAGSSIGVAIRLASGERSGPTCTNVTVVASTGGSGGPGGIGAVGGVGGGGGTGGGTTFWCSRRGGRGGDGGDGGAGGGGGGGCGGSVSGFHIISSTAAEAYVESLAASNSVESLPAGGRGGPGGFSPGHSGSAGLDGDSEAFRLIVP